MSIKGTTKELFIGRAGINILTLFAKQISIDYSEMKRIDYCMATRKDAGYMNFILKAGRVEPFPFPFGSNDLIVKTVNYIKENVPDLLLEEHEIDEKSKTLNVTIDATFGFKEMGLPSHITISQAPSGNIYMNGNTALYYSLVEYTWNGAEYETLTNSTTTGKTNSTTKKKGKSLKIGAGAIIGNVIAGPLGMAVGGAMGAGSKGKSTTQGTNISNTSQRVQNIEKNTIANLSFRSLEDGTVYNLAFNCNTKIDSQIRCLKQTLQKEQITNDISQSLEGIKALKERLDMGVITQGEFEQKKNQLLNM